MIPKGSLKLDYEIEIAFVIGKRTRYVAEKDALSHIAGYAVCNDISERHFQAERGGQWMKGKCAETFGPLGPWLVTRDEIDDVQNLSMSLDVNGQRRQTGNTKTMIFGIAHCLHYISQFMVLEPGDVVTTGTPPGVALGMKPPVWLKAGDIDEPDHPGPRRAEAEGGGVQGVGRRISTSAWCSQAASEILDCVSASGMTGGDKETARDDPARFLLSRSERA